MKVIAFAPAHITGFFQILFNEDEMKAGSRGAGISLSLGSYATVEKSKKTIISKKTGVAREAIKKFYGNYKVKIKNDLPISQGFGISGSSALASSIAISHIENIPYEFALRYSHMADLKNKTGLGDVIASFYGGMECRIEPGIEGRIKKWKVDKKILIMVAGKGIRTQNIIGNEKFIERINETGEECMREFLRKPDFENFLIQSRKFSMESGILDAKMKKILDSLNRVGPAAACMIGNSFFGEWDKKMMKEMKKYGRVYEAYVDNEGARVIAVMD